jgi:hypothetical protein
VRIESLRHVLDGEPDEIEGVERAGEWIFARLVEMVLTVCDEAWPS